MMTKSNTTRMAFFGLWVCLLVAAGCQKTAGPASSTTAPAVGLSSAAAVDVPDVVRNPYAPPVYALRKVATPPVIDGKVDDEAWRGVVPMGRMYLDNGTGAMKFDTLVRLVRDEEYLYVAVDCKHPKIQDVPVQKGSHDLVKWTGETVELFVHTDRSAKGYVQVIFDMSGAFTDSFAEKAAWNGDITAATDVGGDGWRLEARLKIADLTGGVAGRKTDPCSWGFNVVRSTRSQSGSWARIQGNYQQPDQFGLLTMAQEPLAVEGLSLGLYAPPGQGAPSVPVRVRLRNLSAQRQDVVVEATSASGATRAKSRREFTLPAQAATDVVLNAPATNGPNIDVSIGRSGSAPSFRASLPIVHLKTPGDYVADGAVATAIRSSAPVWQKRDGGQVYLLAQSLDGPWQSAGTLSLRQADQPQVIWQCPVPMAVAVGGEVVAKVDVPVGDLKPGSYVLEWKTPGRATARADVDYIPLDRAWLKELQALSGPEALLAKMNCPLPKEPRDLALVQVRLERLTALCDEKDDNIETDLAVGIAAAYRQLTEVVSAIKTTGVYARNQRGWFETAFFSPVDGSAQPYSLFVPYEYDQTRPAGKAYPLLVMLHGSGGTHLVGAAGQDKGVITDRLILAPLARGKSCGYEGVAGNDVLQEIAQAKRDWRIDDDRVHLYGVSMGGGGSFCLGSKYPDLFATCEPLCGCGAWWPVEQMINLPTIVHHGLADTLVAPTNSMVAVAKMKYFGCPVQIYLHPGAPHNVRAAAEAVTTWDVLKDTRRDTQPRSVIVSGNLLCQARAYWLSIARFADVGQGGFARATFVGENHLDIQARNVAWLRVVGPAKWLHPGPLQITLDGGRLWTEITPKAVAGNPVIYIHITPAKVEATQDRPEALADAKAYTGGGASQMFCEGRSVKIVYGTQGDEKQKAASEALAKSMRRMNFNGSARGDFLFDCWPLLKDTEVTSEIMAANDLILLGGPAENALVARLAKDLPVKVSDGKVTAMADAPMQWSAEQVAFRLYSRNPLAPQRRVWWLYGADTADRLHKLAIWYGQESLVVQQRAKPALVGYALADEQWNLHRPGPATPARGLWPDRTAMMQAYSQALKDAMPVDLVVQYVSMDEDNPDWSAVTAGEMTADLGRWQLFVISLSGKDLKRWQTIATTPATAPATAPAADEPPPQWAWAGPSPESIKDGQTYRILVDDSVADHMYNHGADVRVLEYIPPERLEPIAQRYLKSVGLAASPAATTLPARSGQ